MRIKSLDKKETGFSSEEWQGKETPDVAAGLLSDFEDSLGYRFCMFLDLA